MKKIIYAFCLILCFAFTACKNKENVKNTIKWIDESKKPIIVRFHSLNGLTNENRYTLISADSKIYNTECVELSLPDTIK